MGLIDNLNSWGGVINSNTTQLIYNQLLKEDNITPCIDDIFNAFKYCNYNNLKVVMIGQDPYPQKGVATGILFGNKENTEVLSPSLELVKEAVIDYTIPHNTVDFDITLKSWSRQGVLLLNYALTTRVNQIGVHYNIWKPFMVSLLKNLSEYNTGLIYVLLGKAAQSLEEYINLPNNYIFKYYYPAYAARNNIKYDCDVFNKINTVLKKNNNIKIKWYNEYKIN